MTTDGTFDSEKAYGVWMQLIADEELYRACLAGRHAELARSRDLDAIDIAILDVFQHERGTRWNIENLRFRAAVEVATKIQIHLPGTAALLTEGNETWLQEIAFEYLAYYRWQELGHYHFAECDRFVAYIYERIARRRSLPAHLDVMVKFEQSINHLVRGTRELEPGAFPIARSSIEDAEVVAATPRWAPAVMLIELEADITAWIQTGKPQGDVALEPIAILAVIPSLAEPYRVQRLSDGARLVLERCTGQQTAGDLADAIEAEDLGLERPTILASIKRWILDRTLSI
jgi:hypothetical protein